MYIAHAPDRGNSALASSATAPDRNSSSIPLDQRRARWISRRYALSGPIALVVAALLFDGDVSRDTGGHR